MKVIYKPTMMELLDQAIDKATDEGREIERIELTEKEFEQLRVEIIREALAKQKVTRPQFDSYRGVLLVLNFNNEEDF